MNSPYDHLAETFDPETAKAVLEHLELAGYSIVPTPAAQAPTNHGASTLFMTINLLCGDGSRMTAAAGGVHGVPEPVMNRIFSAGNQDIQRRLTDAATAAIFALIQETEGAVPAAQAVAEEAAEPGQLNIDNAAGELVVNAEPLRVTISNEMEYVAALAEIDKLMGTDLSMLSDNGARFEALVSAVDAWEGKLS